jgi:hypothetical protein
VGKNSDINISLVCFPSDTVFSIKCYIQEIFGISCHQQQLESVNNMILDNNLSLFNDYGIKMGDQIKLLIL